MQKQPTAILKRPQQGCFLLYLIKDNHGLNSLAFIHVLISLVNLIPYASRHRSQLRRCASISDIRRSESAPFRYSAHSYASICISIPPFLANHLTRAVNSRFDRARAQFQRRGNFLDRAVGSVIHLQRNTVKFIQFADQPPHL